MPNIVLLVVLYMVLTLINIDNLIIMVARFSDYLRVLEYLETDILTDRLLSLATELLNELGSIL